MVKISSKLQPFFYDPPIWQTEGRVIAYTRYSMPSHVKTVYSVVRFAVNSLRSCLHNIAVEDAWLRPMSDRQQTWATLSHNFVAQQSSPGNCQFSIDKQSPNMTSSDTYGDIIISSTLLIASMFYQRRQVNVRKHQKNSWACKQTTDQSQLSDRARNCLRIEIVSIQQFSCLTRQKLSNSRLGPPIPTVFGNTGISVFYKINTGIPVLIPVLGSMTLLEQNLNDSLEIGNTGQPNAKNAVQSVIL